MQFANQKLQERGEFYFTFTYESKDQVLELSQFLSIDNVQGTTVYAYANVNTFETFKQYHIPFTPVYEYYNTSKALTMATTTAEMAGWDRYPTHAVYLQMLDDFVANYPNLCRLETIGFSENGVPIKCLVISDNVSTDEDEPEFWWSGTMHGDETTGYVLLLRFADYLLSNYGSISQVTNMVDNIEIYINPLANPDGTFAGSPSLVSVSDATRANENGVDLNRNFPRIDGTATTIESEITCMMDYCDIHDFVMSANTHGGIELMNYPWDNWQTWENIHPDDSWWQYVCFKYATPARDNSPSNYFTGPGSMDYPSGTSNTTGVTHGANWYYAKGSRQDYMNYFKNIREVTVELSDTKSLAVEDLNDYWNYNRQALLDYTEQVLYGFRGIVTDACDGSPLTDVKVEIVGHDQDNTEVYTSAPIGNYHRPILAGTYDVTFSLSGYQDKTISVNATNDATNRLDVELVPDGTGTPNFTGAPTSIFEGESVNFTDASSGTITSRNWTFEGGTPTLSTATNPSGVSYATAGTYDVTLEIVSNGCTVSELKEDYITVAAAVPVVSDFTADQTTVSQGSTVNFTDLSTNNPDDWTWTFSGGTPASSTDQNPSIVYNTPGTYDVVLTATNTFGGNTETKVGYIIVTESDLLMSDGTSTRCSGLFKDSGGDAAYSDNETYTHTIYPSTPGSFVRLTFTDFDVEEDGTGCYDYLAIYDGETTATEIGTYCNTDYNIIGTSGIVTSTDPSGALTLHFSSDGGVTRDGWVAEISCYSPTDPPVANFTSDVTSTCTGIVQFEDLSYAATGWSWNFGDGSDLNTDQNPTHTYTANGTYTVSLSATNAYGDNTYTITDMITVDMPVAPVTTDAESCGAADLTLSATGSGTLSWYDALTGGTEVATGTSYTNTFTSTTTLYVQSEIDNTVTSSAGEADNNYGTGGYFTNTQQHGLIFDAYQDFTIVSVYMYSGATADKTITLKNSSDEVIATATVNVPTGGTRVTLNFDVPAGTGYKLLGPGSPNLYRNQTGSSYPYDVTGILSINDNTAGNLSFYYYFYDWEVVTGDFCISSRTPVTATINDIPTVDLGSSITQCGGSVDIDAGSGMSSYTWNGTAGSQTYTATTSDTYTVVVENAAGCTASSSVDVTINNIPAAVVVSGGGTQCGGDITLTATNGGEGTIYYQGTTTDGTSTATSSASETVTSSGTYYFRAQSAEGCWGDEGSASVTINDIPVADAPSDVVACDSYFLPSLTTGEYYETSGGINHLSEGTEIITDQTIYVYSDNGSCTAENSFTVTINQTPIIDYPTDVEVCDSYILPVLTNGAYFANTGGLNPITVGTEITSTQTIYVYAESGTSPNCFAETSFNVTINNATPVDIGDNITGDCGATVMLDASTGYLSYEWNGTAGTQIYEVITTGLYTVVVEDADGCTSTDFVNVEIRENPVVNVTTTPESAPGANDGTATANASGGIPPYFYNWDWAGAITQSINGLSGGTYCVTVTENTGCTSISCGTVDTEGVAPVAALSADVTSGCDNLTVQFADESANIPTSWSWDFGDGSSTSSDTNPIHTYTEPGTYSVSLTVTNATGNNSVTMTDYITFGETPALTMFMTQETATGFDGTATVNITGGQSPYSILWSNSESDLEIITGLNAGGYCVTVTETYGCSATDCVDVTSVVLNPPLANFTADETEDCGSLTVSFTDLSTNSPTSWEWNFGDGTTSNEQNPTHEYNNSGSYIVSLTVENTDGNDYLEMDSYITVFEEPVLTFVVTPESGVEMCDGQIEMTITGGNAPYDITWSNSLTTTTIEDLCAGLYSVVVEDVNDCMSTEVVEVTVSTAISDVDDLTVEIYPNPTNGKFTVKTGFIADEISIIDALGRTVAIESVSNNEVEIDVELQPGIYIIKIINDNKAFLNKLIVE